MSEVANARILENIRAAARDTDSEAAKEQHKLKKLTAFERINALLDDCGFVELNKFLQRSNAAFGYNDVSVAGEGVITGYGTIAGRPVYVFAQDYTALKGSIGAAHADKIVNAIDLAKKSGVPVIGILDTAGARIQEGAAALNGYAKIFKKLAETSGVVPTICVVAGEAVGSAAYIASLMNFTFIIDGIGKVMLEGTQTYETEHGNVVDANEAFGALSHNARSGAANFFCANEQECFAMVKQLLDYLPLNNMDEALYELNDDLNRDCDTYAGGYDTLALINDMADAGTFLEVSPYYGTEMITGFAKFGGAAAGVIANVNGAQITSAAARKAAKFISFLDAFSIPLVSIIGNEGIDTSIAAEQQGLAGDIAKLIYAAAESISAKVSVIAGKAIGAGYTCMPNKGLGADAVFAWCSSEIACLDAEAGAIVMFCDEIAATGDRAAAAEKYADIFSNPFEAARQGIVDEVILPAETRKYVISALEMASLRNEQPIPKKHGVMPL